MNGKQDIPAEVRLLEELEELVLSRNRIRELPVDVGHLPLLRVLNLSSNLLSSLPPSLSRLRSLTEVLCIWLLSFLSSNAYNVVVIANNS